MSNLFLEFKKMISGKIPDENLLVPLLIWSSGSEKNIQVCQNINKKFFNGNRKVFISELTLNNKCKHIVKYPKITKDDEKTKFFFEDVCSYFDWTDRELQKNIFYLNLEEIKETIATTFGYNNEQRKIIKLEGLSYGRSK